MFTNHFCFTYTRKLWIAVSKLQTRAVRLITNSHYIAHTEPLLKESELLKVHDMFCLKILKFYYNVCSDVLPPYIEVYRWSIDINDEDSGDPHYDLRTNTLPLIRIHRTLHYFAESSLLFQLINVINLNMKIIHKS